MIWYGRSFTLIVTPSGLWQARAGAVVEVGSAMARGGQFTDPERLVPAYAVAPRGAPASGSEGGMAWSRDPR